MYSGRMTESEKDRYLALREKIVQYENIVREYSPLGMDDGDDFSECKQAMLDDEGFRKRFAQEVRFAIDPVRLARKLAGGSDFVFDDELTENFIRELNLTDEANKVKAILQEGRDSRKFGDLDIIDSLLKSEFTEEERKCLMLLGAKSVYESIVNCKIYEDEIGDTVSLVMDRLDLAGVEHEISEDDFIEAAINTCNNKLK